MVLSLVSLEALCELVHSCTPLDSPFLLSAVDTDPGLMHPSLNLGFSNPGPVAVGG